MAAARNGHAAAQSESTASSPKHVLYMQQTKAACQLCLTALYASLVSGQYASRPRSRLRRCVFSDVCEMYPCLLWRVLEHCDKA